MENILFLLISCVLFYLVSGNINTITVATNTGRIKGFISTSTKGKPFYSFNKIPFAQPPLGKLRFKNPVPIKPWKGIRDGSLSMVDCSHPEILGYMKTFQEEFHGEEDCLHLSVYKPKEPRSKDPLPVLFFIHGGAFLSVGGRYFTGEEFMNEDVILVVTNYRLGILGFLSTEDEIMPGNLGLKDQNMALRWTKENIRFFGGDPERITIFGESAGGASVHYHTLSPYSKGLFNRAIAQSGTALCPWTRSRNVREIAMQVGAAVGCFTPASMGKRQSEVLLDCLQSISSEEITMAFKNFMIWNFLPVNFAPYVDGDFLPDEPHRLMKEGKHNNVDLMIGVTKEDGSWLTWSVYSDNNQIQLLKVDPDYYAPLSLGFNYEENPEDVSRKAYDYYIGEISAERKHADNMTKLLGDRHFSICSDLVALRHSENTKSQGKKTYFYELEYHGKEALRTVFDIGFGDHWIGHADDVFLQFPLSDFVSSLPRSPEEQKMTDMINKMWINFAATGNPTPKSEFNFTWQPFSKDQTKHLAIKPKPEMQNDKRIEARKFWKSLKTKENQLYY